MTQLEKIIKEDPKGIIAKAYKFSERAHRGQKRKTGEPYFNHPKAVADILIRWHLDEATIAAGLLHDIVEDTEALHDEVQREFGEEITFIVDGVTKLGKIKYRGETNKLIARARAENLRKLFLALSEDLRVVFVKLADRLHNMRTLSALPTAKQKRIALETDEIYAPLAYRLGMHNISGELKDLAFPYLHPKEYEWLRNNVPGAYEERRQYLEKLKPAVEKALKENHIKPLSVDFRAKRFSSLYSKLLRYEMDLSRIYDLVAMRIVVNSVSECYAVMGLVHNLWPPLPGRIKDYIAMPKPNGYRSIHTTIIAPENRFVEIQIRTAQMHEENENGIAAHWIYKQNGHHKEKFPLATSRLAQEVEWVKQLRSWQEKSESISTNPEAYLNAMKIDFFKDRIFAITPKGEVLDLPVGATPVDFAYQIHTDIGNSCIGAKVNDKFVPLDHELRSGDVVQILTQNNKKPSLDWLKFVKTSGAKDKIRASLNQDKKSFSGYRSPSRSDIKITVEDRLGLLKEITAVITRSHIYISDLKTISNPGSHFPNVKIQCQTADKKKMDKLILKLKKLKGIREVSYTLS
ncbi:MAG: bifunctional (p)ppGpp synthetase/guanosine-3',5'-bis(diphosphate) 3'-pyrophosphohydrolase [Anaplasmataceae bacterium]|nr:bifunctional (p)ppGpp synthetase/guanosine-3',5'-bis(diphosphate) 3'-pyrophosphohydrolase [Anaplasmataceae bacterium]